MRGRAQSNPANLVFVACVTEPVAIGLFCHSVDPATTEPPRSVPWADSTTWACCDSDLLGQIGVCGVLGKEVLLVLDGLLRLFELALRVRDPAPLRLDFGRKSLCLLGKSRHGGQRTDVKVIFVEARGRKLGNPAPQLLVLSPGLFEQPPVNLYSPSGDEK